MAKGLSAGRVQSVAVRLVVEREREIQSFKPEEYWKIAALLAPQGTVTLPAKSASKPKSIEAKGKGSKTEANGEPRLLHTVRGVGYSLRES